NLHDVATMHLNGIFIMCGFFFIGYFIFNRKQFFNLYFGLFCIILSLRFFSKSDYIYSLIHNTGIISRIELTSTMLLIPTFFLFLQNYFYETRITRPIRIITAATVLFAAAEIFLPFRFAFAAFTVWQFCALAAFAFLVYFIRSAVKSKKKDVVRIAVFVGIALATALWDLLDAVFFMTGIQLMEYGFFVMLIRMAFLSVQRFFEMLRETERLNGTITRQKNAFYRFVPVDFLHNLGRKDEADIELGDSVYKNMSVLFSDICSFTTLSEKMTPEENFRFLNGFFWRMEPCISRSRGFVDKYMGDGILALFDTPPADGSSLKSSADCALQSAIEMRHELTDYNAFRKDQSKESVNFGVGINTGPLMLGTIGSEHRLDTTVIGNTVNL
ncbi:MAG: adenylate/guanylate cyclase domain-containing protein, partial [Spirochaetota bacterium]